MPTAARRRPEQRRPVFELKLEGTPGTAGIRDLRWLLKRLLRQHGFRCTDAREIGGGRS
jgi:hypothetical protein